MSNDHLTDIAYRHFIESVKDYAIYMLSADGTVISWNEGARRAKGYLSDEIIGRHFGLFYSEAEQLSGVPAKNLEIALRSGQFEGEGWRYRKDGSRFWAHVMIDTIRDEQNTLLGFAKITRDISEQKAINDRIAWMARYDALTGLPNRVEFFDRVEKLITGNDARRFAISTIDLDKFKEINDLQGHLIGDQLLQRVAGAVLKTLQKEEMVARFGGDEFVAVKPFSDEGEVDAFAARLWHCFSGKQTFAATEVVLSASIGISVYPEDGTDINTILSNSDLAMYRAKSSLDHKICWYEREMDDKTRQRNMMAADIRRGIHAGEFSLHYQAIRNIKDRSITGYEALLRWQHPQLGTIPPDVFIPIAEESGAIVPLGYWVLEQVCNESLENGLNRKVSVNISPVQLRHRSFIEKVREILMRTAYPVSLLEFEVTETAFVINKQLAFSVLHHLQKMGISIALDDFGIGYSSLSMLRDFHFDVIKLDRSFMTDVESNPQVRSFVRAIISLGNSINTPLIAEGVETAGQLQILEEEGCDEMQGFLFGEPVDIKHLPDRR
ncbi:putative bifunctional diguanylate cyclase/phosphodiesterase [Klebsiella pneumoniae]|uniref:putative bifunctional diguanylate cyclase/phosphodiesterase n=1 Tax=Klebsiella pneumoniae TaxID=573 RepID=UPI0010832788|nr:EAL domain-containing protein [Klebsiella pneumoniae]VGI50313.1 sensory box/GGDEF family protein [Klebsiella pneumoniae]VGI65270.1 sensory box/GGDEF family protein [Klebsiella pneumoniae]HBY8793136.1 EAL domain-containing protein [Klebsiella pneumoniae]